MGNINFDSSVNNDDAVLIERIAKKEVDASKLQLKLADVNQDGMVTLSDATYLRNNML